MAGSKNYWAIDVRGTADFINRIKRFDKEAARELEKEMKRGAQMVADEAKSNMPSAVLGNWGSWTFSRDGRDLGYDYGKAVAGIKPRSVTRSRRGVAQSWRVTVQEMDPAGAIFMLAGSVPSPRGTDYKGWTFKRNVNGNFPPSLWPRVLMPARNKKGEESRAAIEAAINSAIDKVNNG